MREYINVFCIVYLDDILVYSKDPKEHDKHIRLVFEVLYKFNLKAGLDKCKFNVTKVKFCGYIVTTNGIKMDPGKVKAVLE